MNDRFSLVRQHELHAIVASLDRAQELLQLCDSLEATDESGGTLLALPLRHSQYAERAIRCAADFLDSLRYDGRFN